MVFGILVFGSSGNGIWGNDGGGNFYNGRSNDVFKIFPIVFHGGSGSPELASGLMVR